MNKTLMTLPGAAAVTLILISWIFTILLYAENIGLTNQGDRFSTSVQNIDKNHYLQIEDLFLIIASERESRYQAEKESACLLYSLSEEGREIHRLLMLNKIIRQDVKRTHK